MTKSLKITLVTTLIFVIWVIASYSFIARSFKDPIDMYNENFNIKDDYIGERLEGELPFSLGQCAQLTETKSRNGFKTKKETYYYVIPVYGTDPEYFYYICIAAGKKDVTSFETLTTHFILGTYGNKKIEGTLEELDDETYEYMLDYLHELFPSLSEAELKEYARPICFEQENYKGARIALVVAIILFIATAGLWASYIITIRKNTKKASTPTTTSNVTYGSPNNTQIPTQVPVQDSNFDPFDLYGDLPYEVNGDASSEIDNNLNTH